MGKPVGKESNWNLGVGGRQFVKVITIGHWRSRCGLQ